jgi:hypothetical protein
VVRCSGQLRRASFFPADTFERLPVSLLIEKATSIAISLYITVSVRIEDLGAVAHSANAVTVAFGWIGSHSF